LQAASSSAHYLGGGTYAIAELETPLVAARVLAATVVLPAGILLAFIVAMAVGMAGNELLGYGIGAALLMFMGVALWLLLPSDY